LYRNFVFLVILTLAACNGGNTQDSASDDDTGDDAGDDTQLNAEKYVPDSGVPVDYELWAVANGMVNDGVDPMLAITVSATGYTYLMARGGDAIRYLTEAYIHPTGNYCLEGGAEPDCAGGIFWTSGRINSSDNPNSAWCVDEARGRMFLVKTGVSEAITIDVSFEGEEAYTFNRPHTLYRPEFTGAESAIFDGPCAYLPATDELILSAPDAQWLYAVDAASTQAVRGAQIPDLTPSKMIPLPSSDLVMDDTLSGSIVRINGDDFTVAQQVAVDGGVQDFAVDSERGFVYVAQGETGASRIDLSQDPLTAVPLPVEGDVGQVVVDPTTGTALFGTLVGGEDGDWSVVLVKGLEIADSKPLALPLLLLTPPGSMGDFTVWLDPEDESTNVNYVVFDAVPDPAPDLPPLMIYLISSVEQPVVPGIPCEGEGEGSVAGIQDIIRMNAEVIAGLDIPVTVGLVHSFARSSIDCGMTDLPVELQDDYGFVLGHMVHNDPCYDCTDKPVDGTTPDLCLAAEPDYCDPGWPNWECCFPDHEDYCGLGDWDCYKAFVDEHNVVVDGFIPGGSAFATSADRHEMWDWDWVRGYQEMERADGTFDGYDVTFMGHSWAYGDVVDSDDPRTKHPAPWRTVDGVKGWSPGDHHNWTEHYESSGLLYLPGLPTSTVKLTEWHHSGLFIADYLTIGEAPTYTDSDFQILHQHLRRSINHRQAEGPNVWYFHIHDLGRYSFTEPNGTELEAATNPLRGFVAMVKDVYGARGEVQFAGPMEIRNMYPPE